MDGSSPRFIQCLFTGNTALVQGGAFYCTGNSAPELSECQFSGNSAPAGYGGACAVRDARPTVSGSTFTGNVSAFSGGAIFLRGGRYAVISPGNTFDGNRGCGGNDLAAWSIESTPINTAGNLFTGSADSEAFVLPAAAFDLTGHSSSLQPIDADLFVSPDGDDDLNSGLTADNPFRTIRHALNRIRTASPAAPLTIHLAGGTYAALSTGEPYPLPLLSGVILAGTGTADTILDSGSSAGCLRAESVSDAGLHNLSLTGAKGPGLYCRQTSADVTGVSIGGFGETSYGAGIYLSTGSAVQFNDAVITQNSSALSGGGVYVLAPSSVFTGCLFEQNSAGIYGGGVFLQSGSCTLNGCSFNGNSARTGGAVRIDNGTVTLTGGPANPCIFAGNAGSRGANLSAARMPSTPHSAGFNTFDVSPESAWSVSPAAAFDTAGFSVTGPPLLHGATVYVATDGDDTNDGLTPQTAFRTITWALKRVCGSFSSPAAVSIAEGEYSDVEPPRAGPGTTELRTAEIFPLNIPPWTAIAGTGMDATHIHSADHVVIDCYYSHGSSISGAGISTGNGPGILVESCNPDIDDIGVRNCFSSANGGGMMLTDASPVIENCSFESNIALSSGGAVHCGYDSMPEIIGCIFDANAADDFGGAILAGYGSRPSVSNCLFTGNRASNGGAAAALFGALDADGNTFSGNRALKTGGAVYFDEASGMLAAGAPNVFCKNFAAAGADLAAADWMTPPIDASGSQFCGIPGSEFYVAPRGAFVLTGSSGDPGIRRDIFVAPWGNDDNPGTSAASPFRTLRHALSRVCTTPSARSITVHLAPGVYALAVTEWPYTLPVLSGVTIRGASRESVVIDASDTEGAWFGLRSTRSTLQNLTITGSDQPAVSLFFSDLVLDKCGFFDNHTNASGAALNASGGLLTVRRSVFSSNHAGGSGGAVHVRQYGALLMTDTQFSGNSAGSQGGAVSTWLAAGRAHDCVFTGNSADDEGGAWNSRMDRSIAVTGSWFEGNSAASGGGIAVQQGIFDLTDCFILENSAAPTAEITGYGGGICLQDSSSAIISNTIAGNTAAGFSRIAGGGLAVTGDSVAVIRDSIIWGNSAPAGADWVILWRWDPSSAAISWSVNGDGSPDSVHVSPLSVLTVGQGAITDDPLFATPGESWRLSSVRSGQSLDSPCLETGSEPAWNASYLTPGGVLYMRDRTVETGGWPDDGMLDMGGHEAADGQWLGGETPPLRQTVGDNAVSLRAGTETCPYAGPSVITPSRYGQARRPAPTVGLGGETTPLR